MKLLLRNAAFVAVNIALFFSLKSYYDNRQVRLVDALLPSTMRVMSIGPIYRLVIEKPNSRTITFTRKKVGFGVNGHGSGVFVRKDGLLVTCAHVVSNTPLVELSLDGMPKKKSLTKYQTSGKLLAYVVGKDELNDVALLKVINPQRTFEAVSLARSCKKGLSVLAIGFPGPFNKYVTQGVISGSNEGRILSDVVGAPGSSGCGVFTMSGKLVGLISFGTGPVPFLPMYQGFTGLTTVYTLNDILEKYKGF